MGKSLTSATSSSTSSGFPSTPLCLRNSASGRQTRRPPSRYFCGSRSRSRQASSTTGGWHRPCDPPPLLPPPPPPLPPLLLVLLLLLLLLRLVMQLLCNIITTAL